MPRNGLDIRNSRITNIGVLKPQDIVVTLKLASLRPDETATFSTVSLSLGMSASEVFSATRRATACRLLIERGGAGLARFRPMAPNLREFLVSGLRYVFPAEPQKPARGFRTAQDAPPLAEKFARAVGELPLVWPHAEGDTRGFSVKPLYRSVPDACNLDPMLYEWLAVADALRVGDARVRVLAAAEIDRRINQLADARTG